MADYLLKHGADIELGASTPLMEAAQEGHLDLVRFLLETGADVHAQTQTGDTALTYACENGHTDVADVLMCYGAELEHESEGGRTPLMKACRAGHICTIKFLISKGADVNRQSTSNDHTPLSLACAGGHQAVVEVLLKNGSDPFHKLKDNSTMLIEASKSGHIGVVQLLLDYPKSMVSPAAAAAAAATMKMPIVPSPTELQHVQKQSMAAAQAKLTQQQQQLQAEAEHLQQQLQAAQQLQQHAQQQQQLQTPPAMPQLNLAPITQPLQPQPIPQLASVPTSQLSQVAEAPIVGLQEVQEAVRLSNNQPLFPQPQFSAGDEILPNSINNILDPNAKNTAELQESFLANMRFLRNQGFKDGLALGLARFGLVNNNNGTTPGNTQAGTLPALATGPINTSQNGSSGGGKQKSLLRKNRQAPAPFELNIGSATEGLQTRLQPFGSEDDGSKAGVIDKAKTTGTARVSLIFHVSRMHF